MQRVLYVTFDATSRLSYEATFRRDLRSLRFARCLWMRRRRRRPILAMRRRLQAACGVVLCSTDAAAVKVWPFLLRIDVLRRI